MRVLLLVVMVSLPIADVGAADSVDLVKNPSFEIAGKQDDAAADWTVAAPDHWRALICIHGCQAGKDIYAEKPVSLTIHEGRLIVQAVRRHQRVFQTGSHQRSMTPNRLGCELIRNGRIGTIQRVIAHNYPSP